jgi:hypothetical protein
MTFTDLPASAAWRHHPIQEGFETVFFRPRGAGYQLDGHTSAVEDGRAWSVRYSIVVDQHWATREAQVWGRSAGGAYERRLVSDGAGRWEVDGVRAAELDGLLDVDLESSACTNAMPVHRLDLQVGASAEAPAVYVRALDLRVERLEQHYERLDDVGRNLTFHYRSPAADFEARLDYDPSGLVVDYPGIAVRVL